MPAHWQKPKVCFISSRSGFIPDDSRVVTDWANGRVITELFKDAERDYSLAVFSDPLHQKNYDHTIEATRIYRLPFPLSYAAGLKNAARIYAILKQIEAENDILIIQLPIISFVPLLFIKKPVIYHLCANVLTASSNKFKYRGISLVAARSFAISMHHVHKTLFKKSRNKLIVNGNELGLLYQAYDPHVVVSSSIYKREIISPEEIKPRTDDEFNIIFVGRPSKEKGIHILMKAFQQLLMAEKKVTLHMIGVKESELVNGLSEQDIDKYVLDKIVFHGFVSWGEHFKKIVGKGHCLVMSSVSEGTPRVIIEARALGCPVIATNIGGVSTSITNQVDGILITPGSDSDIINAIISLINDEPLRLKLATNGIETIHRYTLENFVETFKSTLGEIS